LQFVLENLILTLTILWFEKIDNHEFYKKTSRKIVRLFFLNESILDHKLAIKIYSMEKLPRILYAEDNSNDVELTLAALGDINLINQIDVVRDGEEALDYLFFRNKYVNRDRVMPALVLLDLKMPKKDGIEVLEAIRNSSDHANLPVVMLTSSQMETDIYRSYKLGVNAFVVKPIDFQEFVKTIKSIGYFWAFINVPPVK
jgi:CheY-like chemotaxis protein